jgi:hypothetical protein
VAEGDFATVRRTVPMVAEYVKLMSFDEEEAPEQRRAPEGEAGATGETS